MVSHPEVHFKALIWLVEISTYPGLPLTLALPLIRNKSENEHVLTNMQSNGHAWLIVWGRDYLGSSESSASQISLY